MGFNSNESEQQQQQSSQQQSQSAFYGTDIWGPQQPYLQNQYQQAQSTQGNDAGERGYQDIQGQISQLNRNNAQAYDPSWLQTAQGNINQISANAENDPQLQAYSRQIGRDFNQNIVPAIRNESVGSDAYGGSRAGLALGTAASEAQRNIQDFAAQLYGQRQQLKLGAAQAAGNIFGQGQQQQVQNIGAAGQNAQFGMGLPWYAQQQRAGLIGAPVVRNLGSYGTSQGSGQGTGSGESKGFGAHLW